MSFFVFSSSTTSRRPSALRQALPGLGALLTAAVFLGPFVVMFLTSLKSDADLVGSTSLLPESFQWSNYARAFTYIPFARFLGNTLFVCAFSVAGSVLSSTAVAYGFARLEWPGRTFWFAVMMATLMLPAQVTMIPVFILFKKLGWVGSYLPLIVPAFLGNALFIFLLRQFMLGIPRELSEAASIDGSSEFRTCVRIIAPLTKPAIILVALMAFIGSWNDFMSPLIYLNDYSRFTLALGLQQFFGQHGAEFSMLMAACTLMMIPVIVLFLVTQRYFVSSAATTGLSS